MEVRSTSKFEKRLKKYIKKDLSKLDKVEAAIDRFREDPTHPSLNTEKLVNTDIWSLRVNKGDRIFFIWEEKVVLLIDIGKHDRYRRV